MKNSPNKKLNQAFFDACSEGNLKEVKNLLINLNVDIHSNDDTGLRNAIASNQVDTIKYLLTSPNLKEHANIHAYNERLLIFASYNNNSLDIIKFLTSSPDLKEYPNIHANQDEFFKNIFYSNDFEVLCYLIFELEIEKTKDINDLIKKELQPDFYSFADKINTLFNVRDLNKELIKENHNNYTYIETDLLVQLNKVLIIACELNDINLVKFLLTSQKLVLHADINAITESEKGLPLRTAFKKGNLDIATYLLTSSELKEHADIHIASDDIFRSAFFNRETELLQSLIFDYSITRTQNIDGLLDNFKEKGYETEISHIERMFAIRDLNENLTKELNQGGSSPVEKKIKL